MSNIKSRTVYTYKGEDYNSLDAVKTEIENSLGVVIDQINKVLPVHKQIASDQKLAILEVLTANKELLVELLTVEFVDDNDWQGTKTFNILDYK
jgi:hypothetical protein